MLRALLLIPILLIVLGCDRKTARQPGDPEDPDPNLRVIPPSKPIPPIDDPALMAEAAARLKQIGVALHKYASEKGELPSGIVGPPGLVGLSWRVQLLPYLGEEELYKQFRLEEAWDSAHNKPLLTKMPSVFGTPGKAADPGNTFVQSIEGDFAAFRPEAVSTKSGKGTEAPKVTPGSAVRGRRLAEIKDGLSNTLMVVEARQSVEWTKREDLGFYPYGRGLPPVPPMGKIYKGGFHALMCDGQVFFFPDSLPEASIGKLITINRAEALDEEVSKILTASKSAHPIAPPPKEK